MTLTLDQILYTLLEGGGAKSVVIRRNKNPKGFKYTAEVFDKNIHIEEESSLTNSGNNLRDLVAETLSLKKDDTTAPIVDQLSDEEMDRLVERTFPPRKPQLPTPIEMLKLIERLAGSKSYVISVMLECCKEDADDISTNFNNDDLITVLGNLRQCGNDKLAEAVQYMRDEAYNLERSAGQ